MPARDDAIEARLQRWAQWVTAGDGSGFPTMSVLHREWTPPSPGTTPTLKVAAGSDVRQTHRALAQLSVRLRNTVVVHYCHKVPLVEQARRLECAESTVVQRVALVHQHLRLWLADPCAV
jgi:DNA-directed RNA polymerase specialized sigma24 family protein